MMIIARLSPALRFLNMKLLCITNPSLNPLIKEHADVLEIIPYNKPIDYIRARLKTATHRSSWPNLWRYIAHERPDLALADFPYIASEKPSTAQRGKKPVMGICWRTSLIGRKASRDSHLESWKPILEENRFDFISLQYGSHTLTKRELEDVGTRYGWNIQHDDNVDAIGDLPKFAEQVKACDVVVTIDCSTVFLAGGLGVPTYTLVSTDPSFRWGKRGENCPFFRLNTILRQIEEGNWEMPITQAAAHVRNLRVPLPLSETSPSKLPLASVSNLRQSIPPI
jgi:ADP-heptose:LPS heptosyltransferase